MYVPLLALELKEMRGTVVSSSDDLVIVQPEEGEVRKERSTDRLNRSSAGRDHSDSRVVASKGEGLAIGREGNTMNPSSCPVREFTTESVEREFLTPGRGSRPRQTRKGKTRKEMSIIWSAIYPDGIGDPWMSSEKDLLTSCRYP